MREALCALVVAFVLVGAGVASSEEAKPMTNQDVIDLVGAKMSESTIRAAVRRAKPAFNTSTDALIKLKQAGVPESVIEAMIEGGRERASGPRATAPPEAGSPVRRGGFNPEEVILVEGSQEIAMRYLTPTLRTGSRGPWGGFAQYAVLRGTRAALRLKNAQPTFQIAVPSNAQPESYFTVAHLAVRRNGTREIVIGGGRWSYSTGVPADRTMATSHEEHSDQSEAPPGFTIYRITTSRPLSAGEYALVFYNSQVRVTGFFRHGSDSYFDFGVDQ